jgi:hypothetical protein
MDRSIISVLKMWNNSIFISLKKALRKYILRYNKLKYDIQCKNATLLSFLYAYKLRKIQLLLIIRKWIWAVTTVWYLLILSCYDSVLFVVFEVLRQCGICCFWVVTTVWYLLFLRCYDSVVFVVFQFIISERPHHRR